MISIPNAPLGTPQCRRPVFECQQRSTILACRPMRRRLMIKLWSAGPRTPPLASTSMSGRLWHRSASWSGLNPGGLGGNGPVRPGDRTGRCLLATPPAGSESLRRTSPGAKFKVESRLEVRRQPEPARQDPDLPTVQIQIHRKAHLPDAMMQRADSGGRFIEWHWQVTPSCQCHGLNFEL